VLTGEEARAIALARSPLVRALDREYAVRVAEAAALQIPSNPEIGVTAGYPVQWKDRKGDAEVDVTLSQPVRLSFFGERQAVSVLLERSAELGRKLELFKLLKEVDLAYGSLWALERRRSILEETQSTASSRLRRIREGKAKGLFSRGDERLLAGEVSKARAGLLGIESDIRAGQAVLIRKIGIPVADRRLVRLELPNRLIGEKILQSEKGNPLSASQRAELLRTLSVEQVKLARRDAFPEFTPQLLFSHSNEGTTFVGAGISFPLPFSDRNQTEIAVKEAELNAARAGREYLQGEGRSAEILSMVEAVNLALDETRTYETEVIPAFHESLRFHLQQFDAGASSLLQIWQIQREYSEAQNQAIELWTRAFSNLIELELFIGQEIL
jgi:outer membrane protein TolC